MYYRIICNICIYVPSSICLSTRTFIIDSLWVRYSYSFYDFIDEWSTAWSGWWQDEWVWVCVSVYIHYVPLNRLKLMVICSRWKGNVWRVFCTIISLFFFSKINVNGIAMVLRQKFCVVVHEKAIRIFGCLSHARVCWILLCSFETINFVR